MNLTINYPQSSSDWTCHYQGQIFAQPFGVEIDPEERTMSVYYNAEIGNGIPGAVWHGRLFWISLPNEPGDYSLDDMHNLLDEISPLAEELCDHYESRWDGSNWVGHVDQRGLELLDEIQHAITYFEPSFPDPEEDEEDEAEE